MQQLRHRGRTGYTAKDCSNGSDVVSVDEKTLGNNGTNMPLVSRLRVSTSIPINHLNRLKQSAKLESKQLTNPITILLYYS